MILISPLLSLFHSMTFHLILIDTVHMDPKTMFHTHIFLFNLNVIQDICRLIFILFPLLFIIMLLIFLHPMVTNNVNRFHTSNNNTISDSLIILIPLLHLSLPFLYLLPFIL